MTLSRGSKDAEPSGTLPTLSKLDDAPGRSSLVGQTEGGDHGGGPRAKGSLFAGALPWHQDVHHPEPPEQDHREHEHEDEEQEREDAASVDEPGAVDELHDQADDSAHETAHDELPLEQSTPGELPHRGALEGMFGQSFGDVRVHTGAKLDGLGAEAATRGNTIAFADSNPRRELVAHELTHVMQQRNAGGVTGKGVAPAHSGAEREAEAIEAQVAAGGTQPLSVGAAPAGAIHLKRKQSAYAPTDQFNKQQAAGRPKVSVGGRSTFQVSADTTRYSIVSGNDVREFDTVTPKHHITVNISQPRMLRLPDDGKLHKCVLARTRLGGSAWLRADALDVSEKKLATVAHREAGKFAPAAPKGKLKPRVFKAATKTNDYSLTPKHSSQSRAQYDHYLHRTSNKEVQDGFYNVCMALPQHGKVPTAIDVARPGDHFFVMQTREVSLYKNGGSARPAKQSRWAFGCLGKQDSAGNWTPDKSRRGWVPLEALT